jgi:hypothetical protein
MASGTGRRISDPSVSIENSSKVGAENNKSRTSANDARAEREPGPGATGAEDSALLRRLRDRTFRTPDGKAFIAIDSDRGRKIVPIQRGRFANG